MTELDATIKVAQPRAKTTNIAQPKLLAWVVGLTFLVGLLAVLALVNLNQALKSHPRTIRFQAESLSQTLSLADWASSGGDGPELYVVGFPTCPDCLVFKRQELKKFLAAGIEVRAIEFAPRRPDGASSAEEAKAAAVSRSRSFEAYLAPTEAYPLSTAGDIEYVERGRLTVDSLEAVLKANRTNLAFPVFFWRSNRDGKTSWRYIFGSNPQTTENVLKELGH